MMCHFGKIRQKSQIRYISLKIPKSFIDNIYDNFEKIHLKTIIYWTKHKYDNSKEKSINLGSKSIKSSTFVSLQ